LTIAFGVFAVTMVLNLREVEDQASLILRGYLPLTIVSSDLAQRQEDLKGYLDQGILDASRPADVTSSVRRLRNKRDQARAEIASLLGDLRKLTGADGPAASEVARVLPKTTQDVDELSQLVDRAAPNYALLLASPPLPIPNKSDPAFQATFDALSPLHKQAYNALQSVREAEKQISYAVDNVHQYWKRKTTRTKDLLADNERTVRVRAIYLGIFTVVFGFLITAWVTMTLRPLRRLREAARRIASGDYGKRIVENGPTEIADLAREFNSMGRAVQDREEEKLRAARLAMVGKMATHIAHEVRNPLSSISLNTELLEELLEDKAGGSASEARELCRAIYAEVNRLTSVTETYLGLRGGKPKLATESLNTIIGDLVGFVRKDLASRQVALETELDPDDPAGIIDANQIRQCLINLVRNAADAVAVRGGGRVILRTRRVQHRVEIAVEDNGVGIPADALPRLFDPFFTTKESGTGLGLALTQQIVRDHGGDIHVASRVGRGTTFTLSVPAA
jgi:signal transduction histidine kinase